jgi:hypothetical protein
MKSFLVKKGLIISSFPTNKILVASNLTTLDQI